MLPRLSTTSPHVTLDPKFLMTRHRSNSLFCFVLTLHSFTLQPEPQPDNDEHEAQVAAINEQIKKIKDDIEVLRSKIDEANEARRGQGVSAAPPPFLNCQPFCLWPGSFAGTEVPVMLILIASRFMSQSYRHNTLLQLLISTDLILVSSWTWPFDCDVTPLSRPRTAVSCFFVFVLDPT